MSPRSSRFRPVAVRLLVAAFVAILPPALPCPVAPRAFGQIPAEDLVVPKVTTTDKEGKVVEDEVLHVAEVRLFQPLMRTDGPEEVFALYAGSEGYGNSRDWIRVAVRAGKAELRFQPAEAAGCDYRRPITAEELGSFRDFLVKRNVDRLPPPDEVTWDGLHYNYYHVTRTGVHRLDLQSPYWDPHDGGQPSVYWRLVNLFEALADMNRLRVHYQYPLDWLNKKVLFAHPRTEILGVWASGDDVRVLVGERSWHELIPSPETTPRWRKFSQGKIGREAEAPSIYQADTSLIPGGGISDRGDPKRPYDVTTPDDRWTVARDDDGLSRIDHKENKKLPVSEPADIRNYYPICYLPAQGKVVLIEHRDDGPLETPGSKAPAGHRPRLRLLDPATGKSELCRGDPRPFTRRLARPLQATDKPGIVWAAFSYENAPGTYFGRYDTEILDFLDECLLPLLFLKSDDLWIDQPHGCLYIVHQGHLFQLKFPGEVHTYWRREAPQKPSVQDRRPEGKP